MSTELGVIQPLKESMHFQITEQMETNGGGILVQINNIDDSEDRSFEEGDFQDVPPPDIVAYNELRSCADLFRMYDDDSLDISPSFQREVVWKGPAQTRFIDSLIKQLPIPSLCFSYDYRNEDWQVIDGLQRISSVIRFLKKDSDWVLSELEDIDPRISNKRVEDFHKKGNELNKLKRRVENATLPITVLRCDPSLETHSNYLFTIFHRLNTGGLKLNNQEIRNCIYSGEFNDLLRVLDNDDDWLWINNLEAPSKDRFKRQELILRFFAFNQNFERYSVGLAKFLNNYMRVNRNLDAPSVELRRAEFKRVVAAIRKQLGPTIRDARLNLTLFEAVMVGFARNIEKLEKAPQAQVIKKLNALKGHEEFADAKLLEGLSKTARVLGRLNAAVTTFR